MESVPHGAYLSPKPPRADRTVLKIATEHTELAENMEKFRAFRGYFQDIGLNVRAFRICNQ